jgi:hypothetical protein
MATNPNHAFRNPAAPRQAFIGTGHLLHSVARGARRGAGMPGAQDVAGDTDDGGYYSGGAGGGDFAEPEHEPTEQPQDEATPEQSEGQERPGRPAWKPYAGRHRPQPQTPVDQLGRIEDSLGDKLDGPRRTMQDPESGHYTLGESSPYWRVPSEGPVSRPGSTGNMAANPNHPLLANYAHIIAGLQEPK